MNETPLLDVEDIHTYYGDSHVLTGTALEVFDGEVVTMVGRNGVGKTTTLRSILGHTPPRRGEIRFEGESIRGLAPNAIANRGIGWVPEERRIFPALTVREHLRLAIRSSDHDIEDAYEYFPALEHLETTKGGQLSGGEQQMLSIVRGLLNDFELLLIDEPTEGLAPLIVEDVIEALNELKSEVTILLVEQNVAAITEISDRVYIMEKGTIVAESDDITRDSHLIDEHLRL